jgi:hypothetical protein
MRRPAIYLSDRSNLFKIEQAGRGTKRPLLATEPTNGQLTLEDEAD